MRLRRNMLNTTLTCPAGDDFDELVCLSVGVGVIDVNVFRSTRRFPVLAELL